MVKQKQDVSSKVMVPVVYRGRPQMPTSPARARKWVASGKATYFWSRGIYCVRLNDKPSADFKQDLAVGVDTGSKREAMTLKSRAHTFLNLLIYARTGVKESVKNRRIMRRGRRRRNTPYRECRSNRSSLKNKGMPPSTKARWKLKTRILKWLTRLYPITHAVVEDIAATTKKGSRKWNSSFSPLEVGKNWFYRVLKKKFILITKKGFETSELRKKLGLPKLKKKLENNFYAHNVDSFVLARTAVKGKKKPDNTRTYVLQPLEYRRRSLHLQQPAKSGVRRSHGGTRSCGMNRGSLVVHTKYGLSILGGEMNGKVSLHDIVSNKRLCQNANPEDLTVLTNLKWRLCDSSYA